MYNPPGVFDPNAQGWAQQQPAQEADTADAGEEDLSHRPPNAFILYSQQMRSEVRQQNPSLSNTEVSRILGKMWKEVPNDTKLQYKQKAAALQQEFKKNHPDYTYRKARRKRALNELLTKSTQGYAGYPGGLPMDIQAQTLQMMQNGMFPQMGVQGAGQPGQPAMMVYPGMPMMGAPGMATGMPGMDPSMQSQMQGMGR
ncbi:HMG box family protein [Tritrichomonas foetus]|uniref:HMG box family protein n=1 Tax=Tritrichomonas foetus TaxID=1144522 RepID=A0A1J4KJU1_9EUKA|nr:HMG box family protein [Tritrichomonas foetus]|eukprot:OHT11569.1 HMG box family protein [Tritrichomonas foetus]